MYGFFFFSLKVMRCSLHTINVATVFHSPVVREYHVNFVSPRSECGLGVFAIVMISMMRSSTNKRGHTGRTHAHTHTHAHARTRSVMPDRAPINPGGKQCLFFHVTSGCTPATISMDRPVAEAPNNPSPINENRSSSIHMWAGQTHRPQTPHRMAE